MKQFSLQSRVVTENFILFWGVGEEWLKRTAGEFNGFFGGLGGDGVQGVTIITSFRFFLIEIEYFLVVIEL